MSKNKFIFHQKPIHFWKGAVHKLRRQARGRGVANAYATTYAYVVNLSTEGGQKSSKSCLRSLCMAPNSKINLESKLH